MYLDSHFFFEQTVFCCCEVLAPTALLRICLPVRFRGSPRPLECEFVKAAAAAELNCLVLWNNQKHTQQQQQSQLQQERFLFEWRLCREGLPASNLGQLLLVKDCVWQADPGCTFHSKASSVTRTNAHTEFPSHPLHSSLFRPLALSVD